MPDCQSVVVVTKIVKFYLEIVAKNKKLQKKKISAVVVIKSVYETPQ